MLKRIIYKNKVIGMIFRREIDTDIKEGINFLTEPENSFQVSVLAHPKGHIVLPHMHYKIEKKIYDRQEMLYVESGVMKISFFTEDGNKICEEILNSGDLVLLIDEGHGMEILEENTKIIYVKQGPYVSREIDKKVFGEVDGRKEG